VAFARCEPQQRNESSWKTAPEGSQDTKVERVCGGGEAPPAYWSSSSVQASPGGCTTDSRAAPGRVASAHREHLALLNTILTGGYAREDCPFVDSTLIVRNNTAAFTNSKKTTGMAKTKKKSAAKKASKPVLHKSPVQPLGDRVLVKREDIDVKSPSGIIIPDTAKTEKSKRGVIIAVGEGRMNDEGFLVPMQVKAGQKVFFNSGWDNEVKVGSDEEEYFLVRESDILAVIN